MTRQIHQSYPQNLNVQELTDPHLVLIDFFDDYELPDARKYIDSWLDSLYRKESWNMNSPCDLIHFYEKISRLLEAGWIIDQMNNSERSSNLSNRALEEKALMSPELYCTAVDGEYPWRYFPRSLKKKEFINPYNVFVKLFRFHTLGEWKKNLNTVLHSSLSADNVIEPEESINILGIKKHLDKLVDACYLINVREFKQPYVEGILNKKAVRNNV